MNNYTFMLCQPANLCMSAMLHVFSEPSAAFLSFPEFFSHSIDELLAYILEDIY